MFLTSIICVWRVIHNPWRKYHQRSLMEKFIKWIFKDIQDDILMENFQGDILMENFQDDNLMENLMPEKMLINSKKTVTRRAVLRKENSILCFKHHDLLFYKHWSIGLLCFKHNDWSSRIVSVLLNTQKAVQGNLSDCMLHFFWPRRQQREDNIIWT